MGCEILFVHLEKDPFFANSGIPDGMLAIRRLHKSVPELARGIVLAHLKFLKNHTFLSLIFGFNKLTVRHIGQEQGKGLFVVLPCGIDKISGMVITRVGVGDPAHSLKTHLDLCFGES